jgi:hypothetical protein
MNGYASDYTYVKLQHTIIFSYRQCVLASISPLLLRKICDISYSCIDML